MTARVLTECDCCGAQCLAPFPQSLRSDRAVSAGGRVEVQLGSPGPGWTHLADRHYCPDAICQGTYLYHSNRQYQRAS